jgi:cytochrome c oxidase assembly protein subunit 11
MQGDTKRSKSNARLALKIALISVGMFYFAVGILPPMYEVFCDITGLNGKTSQEAAVASSSEQKDRVITVQFLADVDNSIPWEFRPEVFSVSVHPGEVKQIAYFARNNANVGTVGQAVPSVAPAAATPHFKKTQCFCFDKQPLGPGESKDMPVVFYIDPALPEDVKTITLSYSMFNFTNQVAVNDGR